MKQENKERVYNKNIFSLPILVVDDLEFNRNIITSLLKGYKFTNLHTSTDGLDAIEKIKDVNPSLIILDIIMPNMDGFELCAWVRGSEEFNKIPILVQTSLEDAEDRNQALMAGADDVVHKPINPEELYNRTCIQLENAYLLSQLRAYQERLEDELHQARELQTDLFPSPPSVKRVSQRHELEIASIFIPSSELTGDIWGILSDAYLNFGIYIADFSGHGVSAAVNTFRLTTYLESLQGISDPPALLHQLNNHLFNILPTGKYATFLYGNIIDDEFVYSVAGACQPIVLLPNGEMSVGDNTGLPLGIKPKERYASINLPFPKGSTLLVYSDALLDMICMPDLDVTPICNLMREHHEPQAIIEAIKKQIPNDETLDDDLTMAAIKRLP